MFIEHVVFKTTLANVRSDLDPSVPGLSSNVIQTEMKMGRDTRF